MDIDFDFQRAKYGIQIAKQLNEVTLVLRKDPFICRKINLIRRVDYKKLQRKLLLSLVGIFFILQYGGRHSYPNVASPVVSSHGPEQIRLQDPAIYPVTVLENFEEENQNVYVSVEKDNVEIKLITENLKKFSESNSVNGKN